VVGVGHQNQDKRWTPSRVEEDGDDTMDVDPAPEHDTHMDEDSEDACRMQAIRDLATKMTSGAAGDDRDVESSYNSDDSKIMRNLGCWMSTNYSITMRTKRTTNSILDHTTEKRTAMRTQVLIIFRIFYNYSAYF
jgi:hypothetical protein